MSLRSAAGEVVHCDCGFEARGATEDELVVALRRHALEVHGMPLSSDEALLLASRSELHHPRSTTRVEETEEQ